MQNSTLRHKVARNSIFNLAAYFWKTGAGFLLIPYIIPKIGLECFGLWSILAVVTSFVGFMDFGIGTPFIKYIAEHHARRDHEKVNAVVTTGLLSYLVFSGVVLVIVFPLVPRVLRFFTFSPSLFPEAVFVVRLGLVIYLLETSLSSITFVLRGVQRFDLTKSIQMAGTVAMVIGTVVALEAGYGIRGLVVNDLVVYCLVAAVEIVLAFRLVPTLRIGLRFCRWDTFRELFLYGIKLQVSRLAALLNQNLDKILIAHFFGLTWVTYYHLGMRIAQMVKSIPLQMIQPLVPAFSEASVTGDRRRIYSGFLLASKYLSLIAVPAMALLLVESHTIFRVWMGSSAFGVSAWTAQILLFCFFTNIVPGGGITAVVQGIGHPEIQMRATLIAAVANAVLSVSLILWIGYYGAPLGTMLAMLLAMLYYLVIFYRVMERPLAEFFVEVFWTPLKWAALAGTATLGLHLILPLHGAAQGRLPGLVRLAGEGVFFLGLFGLGLRRSGYIERGEMSFALDMLPGFVRRRFHWERENGHG